MKFPIFRYLKPKIIVYIGKFYDTNTTATFTAKKLYIRKEEIVLLEVNRSKINGTWHRNIQNEHPKHNITKKNTAKIIYETRKE